MSEVKVNKISPRTNCGTVQLGDSGDTFTIPAGATITNNGTAAGFGATGAASWDTTVKTTGFTAVSGVGYFVNTTGGAISVNLPAGTAGAVVAIKDYAGTFDTNAVTLVQNGSDKIGGSTDNSILGEEGIAVTLVFIDSTQGWLVTDSGLQSEAPGPQFITATGGTISTVDTDYKVHTFTGPGTFTVTCAGNSAGSNSVDYLVVAGGGSGGGDDLGGGGGGGGFRATSTTYTIGSAPAAPLTSGVSALPVSAAAFPITVGGGGAGVNGAAQGNSGSNSIFSTITSAGGGGAGAGNSLSPYGPGRFGLPGGSGGGGGFWQCGPQGTGGTGNTPPVSPPQGNSGGTSSPPGARASGGGGAIAVGSNGTSNVGGAGGIGGGLPNALGTSGQNCGSYYYFSGGGGGSGDAAPFANGALGGGGDAGPSGPGTPGNGTVGTVNTGGGGGGAGGLGASGNLGAAGGSGIVIIRYKFQ